MKTTTSTMVRLLPRRCGPDLTREIRRAYDQPTTLHVRGEARDGRHHADNGGRRPLLHS
jgi:hypothetical protein